MAGLSICASIAMGEPLVAAILVLMLSGGGALESFATRRASSVLEALAKRMPLVAHRKSAEALEDVPSAAVEPGDVLIVLPHELCPVDGVILEGHGTMDESYLTGEPYQISKTPGSTVLSGAINGEAALVVQAKKRAADSRYASIMKVMADTQLSRPRLKRLGDRLAAAYVPLTLAVAAAAWLAARDPHRALAVLVVATPCPLLIAIPVAVIGAISLAAKRGIIVKDPTVLERITGCRTVILDKTGTLTFGRPALTEIVPLDGTDGLDALKLAASLERYSRHPLAHAVLEEASRRGLPAFPAESVSEAPGKGLSGLVHGKEIAVLGRKGLSAEAARVLPEHAPGLECVLLVDGKPGALLRFRDAPRPESAPFLSHLGPSHGVARTLLVSGDRETEVRWLADLVGIREVHAQQSPEQKVALVREETAKAQTLFVGDGINDAPALTAATVGVAMGQNSDVTSEAAGAVIMTASIAKLDELMHVGGRMRAIALQSAVGGMALSLIGMAAAAAGWITPIEGAVAQEFIDLAAILNALRVGLFVGSLRDF